MSNKIVGQRCFNCGIRPVWADDLCSQCWKAFPSLRPEDGEEFEDLGIKRTLEDIRNLKEV